MTKRDKLADLKRSAENQKRFLYSGYSGEEDPMPEIEAILERQIALIKIMDSSL